MHQYGFSGGCHVWYGILGHPKGFWRTFTHVGDHLSLASFTFNRNLLVMWKSNGVPLAMFNIAGTCMNINI